MADAPAANPFARRVRLRLDGMDAIGVRRDVPYGPPGDDQLVMDVYGPPAADGADRVAAVVIVAGYPGSSGRSPSPPAYKDWGWTVSMAQLIAASGMAAVAYRNREPAADLDRVLAHLEAHGPELGIDAGRLGLLAASGNVPTALGTLMRDARRSPSCAALLYGCLLDLDGATDVADTARQFGFANPCAGRVAADVRSDVPLFLARAGRDEYPAMNASIDRFVGAALGLNLPITLVNHASGPHAFDLFDESDASRDTIRAMLRFLQSRLAGLDSR